MGATKQNAPLVEHWDDERDIGNGVIVTLVHGAFFYDDCGVMGFDTPKQANAAITLVRKAKGESA